MRRKIAWIMACAAGASSGVAPMVKGGTFVDHFNNGSVVNSDTITNFWSTGSYNAGDGSTITEPVGGPLTLAYPQPGGVQGGPYMYSAPSSEFNFYSSPLTLTLTAAPGGNLIPGTDESVNNVAETYLAIEGNSNVFRPDFGTNRIVLQISNQNVPEMVIKDSNNFTIFNYAIFNPVGQTFIPQGSSISNIDVTSMFMYVDGTQESSGHFLLNFGETWVDTSTGIPGSYTFENRIGTATPYDIGSANGYPALTQSQLDAMKSGYPNGAAVGLEVLNSLSNFNGNESVSIGELTDEVPEPASLASVVVGMGLLFRRGGRGCRH